MQRLGFAWLIASKPCRERDWCWRWWPRASWRPHTKLATTRWWHTTTLAEDFGVADANEDDLYAAMDWLLARQDTIQKKLAARHLRAGGLVLYDLSSSYFEGTHLSAGQARLQPRWQARHAAGQLRPAHRCARLPGGRVGVRGQHRRQPDLAARRCSALRERLRHRAAGDGGRPRHDLATRPSTSCARPTASTGSRRSRACRSARWSSRGSCSSACSMSAIWSSSAHRTIPASGWWRAAIRSWPSCARTSARSCSRPPRRNLRQDQGPGGCRPSSPGATRSACAWAR